MSGTANEIVSPTNEVIRFGFRDDFAAGGTDVNVNASGTGDTNDVGGVTGLTVDVDSSHTYTADSDISSGFVSFSNRASSFSLQTSNSPAEGLLPNSSLIAVTRSL